MLLQINEVFEDEAVVSCFVIDVPEQHQKKLWDQIKAYSVREADSQGKFSLVQLDVRELLNAGYPLNTLDKKIVQRFIDNKFLLNRIFKAQGDVELAFTQ